MSVQKQHSSHAKSISGLLAFGTLCSCDAENLAGKEVIISRRAAEAVLRGADVFVPGQPSFMTPLYWPSTAVKVAWHER